MKTQHLIAGLATVLVSTAAWGGDEIEAKYHGDWDRAVLKTGEENPAAAGCLRTKLGSMLGAMTLSAKGGVFYAENYVGNEECQGDDFIKAKYNYAFKALSKADGAQILAVPNQQYELTVSGETTVAQLNEKKVCGFEQWTAKTYTSDESPLKDCTFKNMGMTVPPYINNKDLQDWRTRLAPQGNGISVSSAAKPDGEFHHTTYYVKAPAAR